MMLEAEIEALVAAGAAADRDAARAAFAQLREALSAGEVRAAEPDRVEPDRLARQHLGQAGHPARLPVRRHRRHVAGSRPLAVLRQGHAAAQKPGRRAAGVRIVPGGSAVRDGAYLAPRRHLHAADVHQHRRLGRRGHAGRLARAGRLVRAGRRARARQRGGADRRRDRAGRRAAGDRRGRRAGRRQHRHLRRRGRQGARGASPPARC